MIKYLVWIACIVLSGILYRLGGAGRLAKDDGWNVLRKSAMRDWVIPIPVIISLWQLIGLGSKWYLYLIMYILMGLALSTYWDDCDNKIANKICSIINWMYPRDNFFLHGIGVGLSIFPLFWTGVYWYLILIYTTLMCLGMGIISHKLKRTPVVKELCKGFLIVLLLIILRRVR